MRLAHENNTAPPRWCARVAFPLRRQAPSRDGVCVRVLPPQRCLSQVLQGPYLHLGRSYRRLLIEANRRGYAIQLPTREVYLKGPGAIFKGNPERYLTEIQLPVEEFQDISHTTRRQPAGSQATKL